MKKKLTIALSSVIGTALLATAIVVPVALHQKNKKPLMINNNFGAIKNPKDMNDLMIDDGNMTESHPPLMKSEPVDLSSLINKASLGLIITNSDLPTEKELLDLVKKENPKLSEEALQSLSFENISKEGTTIISKNKDDFSGEIKLEYRSRTNSEQEKYNNETTELVKTTWEKSFKNKLHSLMTFGEIFDSLVRKVNREDSKISIDDGLKKTYITTYLKNGANSGSSGSGSNGVQGNSNNKEFVVKVENKDEIKLEIGFARGGTVPTKYIDKNGKEVSTDSWDLSNVDATVITKIGFHDYKGNIRVPVMPKNVKQVPKELPSVVTSLEKTFKGLKSDKVLGIESWDTSNITNLSETFSDTENFNQDLSNWKTSNVTDMSVTFLNAKKFNSPLDKWDTSNVENMQSMFYGASEFNQNISKWDVKKVKEHSNFCTNSGLKCRMSEPECKAQNCPMFCCENNKQCEMCKKAMEMK
ncbi:DUF285 domain-containing protein [Mycoplasmopsis agalactiae]|uniref:BspA family leucine-rich repeat surface protein n=1 Tax=Mycoplasmopsis agalactiae TaxID=2110 RepID=UPI001F9FCB69|nr:BspA family leucine-rich repeat surface protein [Mycoplasmopsis agalactiae]MCE6061683.1 DUF285 domain-containing protein [Mycoplasmopsis agalactiae]